MINPLAKLGKYIFQKAEANLEPCHAPDFKSEICKKRETFPNHVRALISEQFSKLWSDDLSFANLCNCVLEKAKRVTFKAYLWSFALPRGYILNKFKDVTHKLCVTFIVAVCLKANI